MTSGSCTWCAELLDDLALDLVQVEAGHLHVADDRHLDRAVLADALNAEIGALALDGQEDVAAIAFEDADLQRIAGRDGEALAPATASWSSLLGLSRGRRLAVGDDRRSAWDR